MTELKTQKPREERKRTKKVFASLAAVTMVGVAGVAGTTAALSATTENEGNEFDAAYIALTDNDGDPGTFMYNVDNQEFEGDPVERCIVISYVGTKPADVGLYTATPATVGGQHIDLLVEAGTNSTATPFSSVDDSGCANFTPVGTPLFDGTLNEFATDHGAPEDSIKRNPGGAAFSAQGWTDNTTAVYKVTLSVNKENDDIPVGENLSGVHAYNWQADTL